MYVSLFFGFLSIVDILLQPENTQAQKEQALQYIAARDTSEPTEPFHHDGCTLFPDRFLWLDFTKVCLIHDIQYWAGGTQEDRKTADVAFKNTIANLGFFGTPASVVAYTGVRIFGDSWLTRVLDAQWGYGWE